MITYTFNSETFLVILSGNSNDTELMKNIGIKINVTNARYSRFPQRSFPTLLEDNPNQTVDINGNIALSVHCASRRGMAEVLSILDKFGLSCDSQKESAAVTDKSTTLHTSSKCSWK
jgi:hypothetical protein